MDRWLVRRGLGVAFGLTCLFSLCAGEAFAQDRDRDRDRGKAPAAPVALAGPARGRTPGIVLVHFKGACTDERVRQVCAGMGGQVLRCHEAIGVCVVQMPAGRTEEDWAAQFLQTGLCEYAHPDYVCKPTLTSGDPYYGYEWHLTKIHAPEAWDTTTGSPTIVVAVCDSGVDASHPDLAGRVLPGWNTASGTADSSPVASHGTMVSGTIAAAGDNGVGVAGIAWKTKILPVRVSNSSDGSASSEAIADGFVWAADHGAKVINCSMGPLNLGMFNSAATYAEGKGAVVCVSSGNDGGMYDTSVWPDYAAIVYVGASGPTDTKTSFSSYGPYVDCVAPGVSIYTTAPGGAYAGVAGTSFSSPIVAGVFALVFAKNPTLTPAAAKSIVLSSCVDLGDPGEDALYGKGRVDAKAALAATPLPGGPLPDTTPPPVPTIVSVTDAAIGGTLVVTWTASPAPDLAYYAIKRYNDTTGYVALPNAPAGTTSRTDTGLTNGKDYYYYVRAVDASGNTSVWSAYKMGIPSGTAPAPAPPPDTTPPPVPTILSVTNPGTGGKLVITWTASPAADLAYYQINRYTDTVGYTLLASVPAGTTTKTDVGLVNGKDYWYFLRAVDTAGNKSGWSAYKGGVPTGGP